MVSFYEKIAETLVERILDLIPKYPQIMTIKSPWELFDIKEFNCSDLEPTLAQASWALSHARTLYKSRTKEELC